MDDYERVILIKNDVFIYKIPPRTSNRAHRATDWGLDNPSWTGRLRVVAKGKDCILKLEDKTSGELFGKCPVDKYPGIAIESVSDSSRYFVIRLQDDNGRHAFIGIGFSDRGDSFDFNVALQDHFKILQKEEEIEKEPEKGEPKLDLGFKDGQTIKVNLNIAKKSGSGNAGSRPRAKPSGGLGGGILLPPPPAANKSNATTTTTATATTAKPNPTTTKNDSDFLLDLNSLSISSSGNSTNSSKPVNNEPFGDFTSTAGQTSTKTDTDWTQFQ